MNSEHEHNPGIRRIVLPSGRSFEVIRFHDDAQEEGQRELHVCANCDSQLVQPIEWAEAQDGNWNLTLECPNCGWAEQGIYDRNQVEMLENQLDQGLSDMILDLQRLTLANMTAEVNQFAAALDANLIVPEDF